LYDILFKYIKRQINIVKYRFSSSVFMLAGGAQRLFLLSAEVFWVRDAVHTAEKLVFE